MTGSCQYKFKQKIDKNNMQKCSICIHLKRKEIDEALLISPLSLRDIAGQYKVSKSALQRHKEDHMPLELIKSRKADEVCKADSFQDSCIYQSLCKVDAVVLFVYYGDCRLAGVGVI